MRTARFVMVTALLFGACALQALNLPIRERPVLEADLIELGEVRDQVTPLVQSRLTMYLDVLTRQISSFEVEEKSNVRCDNQQRCSQFLVNGRFTVTEQARSACNVPRYVATLSSGEKGVPLGRIEMVDYRFDTCGKKYPYGWGLSLFLEGKGPRHFVGNPSPVYTIMGQGLMPQ